MGCRRQWTQGPWSALHLGRNAWIIECDDGIVASVEHCSSAVDKADAHLIAAAPDLYEALEYVYESGDGERARAMMKAALAKARGDI
jgi:hypothetical protein